MTSKSTIVFLIFAFLSTCFADYNAKDANEFAIASALAYCDPSAIENWSCGAPCQNLTGYQSYFSEVFNVAIGETLAFSMVYNPSSQRFVISYRGTAGTEELLLEILEGDAISYTLSNIPNALVDDYFYNHYVNTMRPVFIPLINNAYKAYPDYQFIFTGHSLGGALTTLAAFDTISSGIVPKSQVTMYNYGSPRVGNQVLAQAIESAIPEIYRVVHWQDLVPHVPPCAQSTTGGPCVPSLSDVKGPSSILWAAWHVQPQIFYNEANNQYQTCSAEDPNCMDQFTLSQTSLNDHSYYVDIQMGCSGTSAVGFGKGKMDIDILQ